MKNKVSRGILLALTVASALIFSGCKKQTPERIYFSKWAYNTDVDIPEAARIYRDLDSKELNHLEQLVPGQKGFIRLKTVFTVPKQLTDKNLACFMGRISLADETFINGSMIGRTGLSGGNEFSAWNIARCYFLPKELIKPGKNTLIVKIWVDGEGNISSQPFIGLPEDAELYCEQERIWHSKMYMFFSFVMIVIAAYHIVIFARRRKDTENILFALINIVSAAYTLVFTLLELPGQWEKHINFLLFQKIFSCCIAYTLPFLVTSFINAILKRKDSQRVFALRVAFVLVPSILSISAFDYIALLEIKAWTTPMLIPPMLYIIKLLAASCIRKERSALKLLAGFSPLIACVIFDLIVHSFLKNPSLPYITVIGWMLVIITLLMILAGKFSQALNDSEYLNGNLSDEVEVRTRELTESNQKLAELNAELESAKFKTDRDMQLAVYVQQSFYQKSIPEFEDWDVAYHFSPMSGVSGDLYDIFTDGKKLSGVGLFDISGHGISSGLVTMLAKNIIDRQFSEGKRRKLSDVMKQINTSLISEKGDIENYMTGAMLRLNGERVEYVNAGHPKLFYRMKSGKTIPVEIAGKGSHGEGGIIGIPGLEPEFSTIVFSMKSGDSLILYTDCLNESRSIEGNEFGTEGIRKAFSEANGNTAAKKIDAVLEKFRAFTEGTETKDDLTVIVIQKK